MSGLPTPPALATATTEAFCRWVVEMTVAFGGNLSTGYKCAAVFAADFERRRKAALAQGQEGSEA